MSVLALELYIFINHTLLSFTVELTITRAVLYLLLALSLVVPVNGHHEAFRMLVRVSLPLCVILIISGMYIDPVFTDMLSREDRLIETTSALMMFAGAAIWLIYATATAMKSSWKYVGIASFAALTMFLIGMEEISWMQRILDTDSNDFFLKYNIQHETNLHNINTVLSETILYVGGLTVLVIMPFYREKLVGLLIKLKCKWLEPFLPSAWLFLPFAVMAGFIGAYTTKAQPLVFFASIFTLALLIVLTRKSIRERKSLNVALYAATATVVLVTAHTFLFFPYSAYPIRPWIYTEYLEFFIELGLLVYTIDFVFRSSQSFGGRLRNQSSVDY